MEQIKLYSKLYSFRNIRMPLNEYISNNLFYDSYYEKLVLKDSPKFLLMDEYKRVYHESY